MKSIPSLLRSAALILLASLASASAARSGPAWKLYSSREGRFSILMPSTPVHTKSQTAMGDVHTFDVTRKTVPDVHMVMYSDFPGDVTAEMIDPILEATVKGQSDSVSRVENVKRIKLGRYPGREFTKTYPGDRQTRTQRTRLYLVERRLYQVKAVTLAAEATSTEATRYFTSFRLLK